MKLTNFTRGPESKSFPIEFASDLNLFEHFPQDFPPAPQYPSSSFNYFNGGFKGGGKKKKHREKSWFDMINPFECESDYDDEDYGDMLDPSDLFQRRKFGKFGKLYKLYKLKKKKKKKKIVLMKILLGILVFIAAKFLLQKYAYNMPQYFSSPGRDELYHDGEHELDRSVSGASTLRRWGGKENLGQRLMSRYQEMEI